MSVSGDIAAINNQHHISNRLTWVSDLIATCIASATSRNGPSFGDRSNRINPAKDCLWRVPTMWVASAITLRMIY